MRAGAVVCYIFHDLCTRYIQQQQFYSATSEKFLFLSILFKKKYHVCAVDDFLSIVSL